MAGRIRSEDVELVRERADLVKVVQQYLQLKKSGRDSFLGLCPFHTEKTPSFSVSAGKQLYYCFGCGQAGNVYRFLQSVENITFPEAVERLAKQVGVTLRYEGMSAEDRRAMSRRQALHRANAEAADLYHRHLLEARDAEEARRYLEQRGISKEVAERFGIGFAPRYSDFLLRRLSARYSTEILVEAGLALKDAEGAVRDRFRSRITFPVHDLTGQAVGFGARLLHGEGPKYLNSPETPVYRKGEMLYNLHRAKGAITSSGRAVVVEGYTDVIALDQGGMGVAVATCGTALGEGHFRLLSRFAERAVLAFDSDEAGARAAERAYGFHEQHSVEPVVLVLPEGLDPADLVKEQGPRAFEELLEAAVPLVEYMIRRAVSTRPLETIEDRVRAVKAALPIVAGLTDPVRREQYAGLLADRVGVDVRTVLLELDRAGPGGDGGRGRGGPREERGARGAGPPAVARLSAQERVEREALKLLVQGDAAVREALGGVRGEHFQKAAHRKAFELLGERGSDVARYLEDVDDDGLRRLVSSLSVESPEGAPGARRYAETLALRLEEFLLTRQISALRKRLEPLNPTADPAAYDSLFQELISLEGARRRVRAAAQEEPAGGVPASVSSGPHEERVR